MANSELAISARRLMADNAVLAVQVKLTGWWLANLRLRLAVPLVWLAAKVAGVGFSADIENAD